MKKERDFQREVKHALQERFPGCIILKNDPTYVQGIPDLTILYKNRWAMLEVKQSEKAAHRPNQDHFVQKANEMSYANFIFPENFEEVLDEVQRSFED